MQILFPCPCKIVLPLPEETSFKTQKIHSRTRKMNFLWIRLVLWDQNSLIIDLIAISVEFSPQPLARGGHLPTKHGGQQFFYLPTNPSDLVGEIRQNKNLPTTPSDLVGNKTYFNQEKYTKNTWFQKRRRRKFGIWYVTV